MLARATCSGRRDPPRPGLWIIADLAELFQAHVAGSARRPLVVLLQEQRADEAHDRRLVGKDGDDVVIVPSLQDPAELAVRFPKGFKAVKPYLRVTPQPNK